MIEPRQLWKEEKQQGGYDPGEAITRPLYPDRADTIVHTEKGEVGCLCPETGRQRRLAFQGFEAARGTLKYRCPAAAYGYGCAGRQRCYRAAGSQAGVFGRIVRIPLATQDRRIFTPTPYGSPSWKRGYRRRPALERIYSRLDNDFGFERHFLRGHSRVTARVRPGLDGDDGLGPGPGTGGDAGIGCARWSARFPLPIPDSVGFPRLGSSPLRQSRRLEKPEGFLTPNGVGSAHRTRLSPRRRQGEASLVATVARSRPTGHLRVLNQQPESATAHRPRI